MSVLPNYKKKNFKRQQPSVLVEVAWEVCNQVGGIYTVISSKAANVVQTFGHDHYCLVGPYMPTQDFSISFEPIADDGDDLISRTVYDMRNRGYEVHYGQWLIPGHPKVVLFNPWNEAWRLAEIKKSLWESHHLPTEDGNSLLDQVIMLGEQVTAFFTTMNALNVEKASVLGHFHEWMVGSPIPEIRRRDLDISLVFTTHATMLGRYLAMNDPDFYTNLSKGIYDWRLEANYFNIRQAVELERAAAHGAHVFTTVSQVTATECKWLLGREVDGVLPNGINIKRFEALHEFQNMHVHFKRKINEFIMGHFFQSYQFDLDNTLYFFTSGRYEFKNKGFDLTLEALSRLNWQMKQHKVDKTVVFFLVTRKPYQSVNPEVLHQRALMNEVRRICDEMAACVRDDLFVHVSGKEYRIPSLEEMVPEEMLLKLRRTIQSWKTNKYPLVVTHNLQDDGRDEVLDYLRRANLLNAPEDKVKIVYHPDFVSAINPLFGIDYEQFVRGCHLGIFPSYYEPWGYTPMECIASGIPTVTSDLAGFGDFVENNLSHLQQDGIYVVKRKHGNTDASAQELADRLFRFVNMDRRDRIQQRNMVERSSVHFDWNELYDYYLQVYQKVLTPYKVL